MPRPVVCPHCGEELDIPAELRDREVRCAVCRRTFVPAAGPAEPPPADHFEDDEPTPSRTRSARPLPKRSSSSTWVWVLLLVGFGCCGLGCGGFLLFGLYIAFPDFQAFDSKEGRFHAEFPGAAVEVADTDEEGRPRHSTEFRRKFPPETYFVRYTDLPPGAGMKWELVLEEALDRAAKQVPGAKEVDRSGLRTVGGYPTMDVTVHNPDTSHALTRAVLAGDRLYVIGMSGGGLQWDTPHVQHFMDAFRVTTADAPAAKDAIPPPRPAK